MPKATAVVRVRDSEARRVGAGGGIGLRRELAQPRIEAAVALRPQLHRGLGLARLAEPGLRQRHHRFLLAPVGEPRHRLADGDDLAGLGQGRGDHAVGVGLEVGIAELHCGARSSARLARCEPPFGLVIRRLLAVEVGDRREALALERGVALQVGGRLGEIGGGGGELGLGAFDLQREVLRIEPGHDVAGAHPVADIDDAGDDLAGDAEAEIGLVARPHHADEFARGVVALERHALHLHRALGPRRRRGIGLAAGEQEQRRSAGR